MGALGDFLLQHMPPLTFLRTGQGGLCGEFVVAMMSPDDPGALESA